MSGATRIKSMNMADNSEARPVLGPGGNETQRSIDARKPILKPLKKAEKSTEEVVAVEDKNVVLKSVILTKSSPTSNSVSVPSMLRRHESLNVSCSSDASTDSFRSRASSGRMCRMKSKFSQKKLLASKGRNSVVPNGVREPLLQVVEDKRRCAWITSSTEPSYVAFHDEEWGVPTHDDKKLFEYLVLSGALAELTWPVILSKRHIFREVFADFDPTAVAKQSEKKILESGSPASSLLSELNLRSVIENARQVSKVIDEFGSFNKYIWSFVNHKPIVNSYRYPCQVPVKTPKAGMISKDLLRRGFRGVGPTVVYSFMQVVGLTNDHLMSCFKFLDCSSIEIESKVKKKRADEEMESEICRSTNESSS